MKKFLAVVACGIFAIPMAIDPGFLDFFWWMRLAERLRDVLPL